MQGLVLLLEDAANTVDTSAVMKTAFESVQTNVNSTISTALPIALGIMGTILAITIGVRFFKKFAKG